MTIRDKIKERLNAAPVSFYVKEWDENIYCTPLSCGEMSKIQSKHPNFLSNLTGEAMADLIILKSLNKDGEKMFDLEDKPYLLRENMALISSVSAQIIGAQISEDYEKN
jgi:uncharacterized protein (UPF0264 family)